MIRNLMCHSIFKMKLNKLFRIRSISAHSATSVFLWLGKELQGKNHYNSTVPEHFIYNPVSYDLKEVFTHTFCIFHEHFYNLSSKVYSC